MCQGTLRSPRACHSGTGNPDHGPYPTSMLLYINEVIFYTQRPFVQLTLSGVFERFPRLKFVMTEAGCSWVPPMLAQLDHAIEGVRGGATEKIRYSADQALSKNATEYFHQNVWMGVSQPRADDIAARHEIGLDRFMWGSDYPHDEGTHPYTRRAPPGPLQRRRPGRGADDAERERGAALRLRPGRPCPLAERIGPTVAEVATPIDAVPDKHLELISGDMDTPAR